MTNMKFDDFHSSRSKQMGFSLAELCIVIVILSMVAGYGLTILNDRALKKIQISRQLKSILLLGQTIAATKKSMTYIVMTKPGSWQNIKISYNETFIDIDNKNDLLVQYHGFISPNNIAIYENGMTYNNGSLVVQAFKLIFRVNKAFRIRQ